MRGLPDLPHRWTLALGPGARTSGLAPLLGALRGASETPRLAILEDLAQLFDRQDAQGRLLLDADLLPREDLGLVRRFLDRRPGWRLWLIGDDPRAPGALSLCAERRARWLPWPLDVEGLPHLLDPPQLAGALAESDLEPDLGAGHDSGHDSGAELEDEFVFDDERDLELERASLAEALAQGPVRMRAVPDAAPGEAHAPEAQSTPNPSTREPALTDDELAEIEAILGDPSYRPTARRAESEASRAPAPAAADRAAADRAVADRAVADEEDARPAPDPFATDDPDPFLAAPDLSEPLAPPEATRPPRWYRAQVADLADLAQRLQLSILALRERREAGEDGERAIDDLDADVLRLVMFARTLGFLAAPPPPGATDIDLSVLLGELLGGVSKPAGGGPRFVLEATPGLAVRSDKGLLVQAFDALLALAGRCASSDEVVRVEALAQADGVAVEIAFPPGPLEGREPADVLEPYGLRRVLPEIGANALAAAGGILEGQGGELALDRLADGGLRFRVTIPRAVPASPPAGPTGGPFE